MTETCPRCTDSETKLRIDWIQCDVCSRWFHISCAKLIDHSRIASYHCSDCELQHGPSHMKRQSKRSRVKIDYVALNQGETFAVDKSMHPHVPSFKAWRSSHEPLCIASERLTKELAFTCDQPILVSNVSTASGLQLPAPRQKITVDYVAEHTGADEPVEVMDVLSQQSESPAWTLGQWRDYFYTESESRDRIRNVISLEISQVDRLGKAMHRPHMVRDLDLVDKVWLDTDGCEQPRPQVTKYCLMSVAGSYTDFHIDFSGTPVYYTVCHGSKTFLMFPPSDANLQLYEAWCHEPHQNFTWFPDYPRRIGGKMAKAAGGLKVNLKQGDLFIIPSGWIHSVYTPDDAVIIGGNFLTLKDIPMHLQIYNLEKRTRVPAKYRFPMFNKVLWLTSYYYLNHRAEFAADLGVLASKGEGGIKAEVEAETELGSGGNEACMAERKLKNKNDLEGMAEEGAAEFKTKDELEDKTISNARAKLVLESLIGHLREHFEMSKTSAVAKKSIPYKFLGKDIPDYLAQLDKWLESY